MPTAARRRNSTRRRIEAGYRAVLADPACTPQQRLEASRGLERLSARRDRERVAQAADAQSTGGEIVDNFWLAVWTLTGDALPCGRQPSEQSLAAARAVLDAPKDADGLVDVGACSFPDAAEEWNKLWSELKARELASRADNHRAVSERKAYFDAHPDRAGEVLKAIGPKEFLRITTISE